MRIQDMSKVELIEQLRLAKRKVNSPSWIRNNRRWWVGVMINHLAKLEAELKSRDT